LMNSFMVLFINMVLSHIITNVIPQSWFFDRLI
jgi:hypothetical protein